METAVTIIGILLSGAYIYLAVRITRKAREIRRNLQKDFPEIMEKIKKIANDSA